MRNHVQGVVFAPVVGVLGVAAAPALAGGEDLEGTWQVVSIACNGKKADGDAVRRFSLQFKGTRAAQRDGALVVFEATMRTDPSNSPKALDLVTFDGAKATVKRCIYERKGNTLRICGRVSGPRPAGFTADKGSGQDVLVLKRAMP